jgi:hypothetical protein
MANVNISVKDGSVTTVPPNVRINPNDLSITWSLAAAGGWSFSTSPAGIVCETSPPPPYAPWNGSAATTGPGPNQYKATGVVVTNQTVYKYSINLVNSSGQTIAVDPEITNDPRP